MQLIFCIWLFLIIEQNQKMQESRMSDRSRTTIQGLPKKEQWALIYEHRALELQKAKSVQKYYNQLKKDNFKQQLDEQILNKQSAGRAEKEEDRKYYEHILKQAQEMKQKEERDKFQRFMLSKEMQEANIKKMQNVINSKLQDFGKVYNIEIGLKSQKEKKQRSQAMKKNVVETLDQQRMWKEQQIKMNKLQDIQVNFRNEQYLNDQSNQKNSHKKKYEQNQVVYAYYQDLHSKRVKKNRELEHKLVDEVQYLRQVQLVKKKEMQALTKQIKNLQMKDTLEKQIQLINRKKIEDHRQNPEHANYSFIGSIFRDKKAPFDKREYSMILQKQIEEQKLNKLQQQYMSEEQYKLNSNQLNKAISGQYAYEQYQDRSMGTLGDKMGRQIVGPLQTEDAQLVKNKLQILRMKKNSSVVEARRDSKDFFN